jgi:hypothetical protein
LARRPDSSTGELAMATITVTDLPQNRQLDRKAMSAIRGAGAPWVFGWIRPYAPSALSTAPVINFYQINNSFYAGQMINQFQMIDVNNTAPNSNVTVGADERSRNTA